MNTVWSLFGPHAMSDLGPEYPPKWTLADHSDFMGSRPRSATTSAVLGLFIVSESGEPTVPLKASANARAPLNDPKKSISRLVSGSFGLSAGSRP